MSINSFSGRLAETFLVSEISVLYSAICEILPSFSNGVQQSKKSDDIQLIRALLQYFSERSMQISKGGPESKLRPALSSQDRTWRELESVAQAKLHHPRCALDVCQLSERQARSPGKWIGIHRKVGDGTGQALSVSDIKDLGAELQLVGFFPGHREGLIQPHIERDVTRIAENVAISGLTR